MERKPIVRPEIFTEQVTDVQNSHILVLFNDEFNLYDYVIDSLVEVCKHSRVQAEQCTIIAHHKGKCDVKSGNRKVLAPVRDELLRRGLTATIIEKK
jgi:ATP-dependent Clp protease adaptor protein ClpS